MERKEFREALEEYKRPDGPPRRPLPMGAHGRHPLLKLRHRFCRVGRGNLRPRDPLVRPLRGEHGSAHMSAVAISALDIEVRFNPYVEKAPTLRRSIARGRVSQREEVVALDGVSFEILRGEAFGIVGRPRQNLMIILWSIM